MRRRPTLAVLTILLPTVTSCVLDWSSKDELNQRDATTDEPSGDAGQDAETDWIDGPPVDAAVNTDAQVDEPSPHDASTSDGSAPACVPAAEVCNLIDDSCDGRVDENLWSPLSATGTRVWTGTSSTQHALDWAQVAFAPTSDGGGWLVYGGNNGAFGYSGDARAAKLDATGTPTGDEVPLGIKGAWSANARGGKLAILYQTQEAYDTQSVFLRVFAVDASALIPMGEPLLILENRDPDENLGDDSLPAFPVGVALLIDKQGALHALTMASKSAINGSQTVYPTQLRIASLAHDSKWTLSLPRQLSQQNLFFFAGLSAAAARAAPIPCRDEWLLVYAAELSSSNRDWRITRVNIAGELLGNDKPDSFVNVDMFVAGLDPLDFPTCGSEAQLILGYRESGKTTRLRRWAIDVESGALRRAGPELDLKQEFDMAQSAIIGGRLFATGVGGKPMLWEVTFDAPSEQRLRDLDLLADGAAQPGSVLSSGTPSYFNTNTAIGPLGNGLLVAYPNGFDGSSNLAAHRPAGDTQTPVAMSRIIGCAP